MEYKERTEPVKYRQDFNTDIITFHDIAAVAKTFDPIPNKTESEIDEATIQIIEEIDRYRFDADLIMSIMFSFTVDERYIKMMIARIRKYKAALPNRPETILIKKEQ